MLLALVPAALAGPLTLETEDDGPPDDLGPIDRSIPEDDGIINGEIERGYPSAVGLGVQGFPFTLCTGSLITPRVVLTAAHCSAGYPIDLIAPALVGFIGSDAADPRSELTFVGGVVHPDYRELSGTFLGENDVAVLFLEEDAKQEAVWFRTERLKAEEAEGAEVISVGWGLDENGAANVKRSAPLVIAELDPTFLVSYSAQNGNQANICSGDSGGPQYHVEDDGTLLQWAVHSWGDLDCRFSSGSTRTDQVSRWILDQVEAEHGTRDRCEIFENYGDGICQDYCDHYDLDCVEPLPTDQLLAGGEGCGCATPSGGSAWLALPLLAVIRRRARAPAGPSVRTRPR